MGRYDEIIEIVKKSEGWTKDVNEILLEIYNNFKGGWFNLRISPCERGRIRILLDKKTRDMVLQKITGIHESIVGSGGQYWVEFKYDGQCEKNRKFKEAILWLLHHSEIKKSYLEGKIFYDTKDNKIFELRKETMSTITCGRGSDLYDNAVSISSVYNEVYNKSRLDYCKEIKDPSIMPELERTPYGYQVKQIVGREVRAEILGKIYKVKILSEE